MRKQINFYLIGHIIVSVTLMFRGALNFLITLLVFKNHTLFTYIKTNFACHKIGVQSYKLKALLYFNTGYVQYATHRIMCDELGYKVNR